MGCDQCMKSVFCAAPVTCRAERVVELALDLFFGSEIGWEVISVGGLFS